MSKQERDELEYLEWVIGDADFGHFFGPKEREKMHERREELRRKRLNKETTK